MLTYGYEPLGRLLSDGILDLAQRHFDEIALDKGAVPLDIDLSEYLKMEADGRLRIFAARRDGRIVGYVFWFMEYPSRYKSTRYVHDHIFWLAPEERHGWNGYYLLKNAIAALPRPCKLQMREKLSFQQGRVGSVIMKRLGLKPIEIVHSAWLE
jgi:hypothetical protein